MPAARDSPVPAGLVGGHADERKERGETKCAPRETDKERGEWLLNRFTLRTWGQWWAGSRDLTDPMVSPLFGDLSKLPPTLMFCGSADILVADARRLVAAAPGKVRYIEEDGLMHVYPLLHMLPEAKRAWVEIERFVNEVLARNQAS